ncbi:hypothetical protein WBK31_32760 [Nonomuraea sp. N2-4H]|uniref:hypothetical protein n=1 Tax=Nonomuraea sp. N2-4H TaxID=3128898 RepID=UPI00324B8E9D
MLALIGLGVLNAFAGLVADNALLAVLSLEQVPNTWWHVVHLLLTLATAATLLITWRRRTQPA